MLHRIHVFRTAASVPANFQSMSLSQLKSVCAAHGLMSALKLEYKSDVVAAIEKVLCARTTGRPCTRACVLCVWVGYMWGGEHAGMWAGPSVARGGGRCRHPPPSGTGGLLMEAPPLR